MGRVARALAAARLPWRAGTVPPIRLLFSLLLIGSIGASVVACGSGNGEKLGERVIPLGQPVPKGGGRYVTGPAYRVDGVWYRPQENPAYDRVGTASWYGELFHGRRTANGEIYDMDRLSAASPTLPMPVYARVTNLQNRRSIIVRVNDRGPYRSDRIIDLSRRSASGTRARRRCAFNILLARRSMETTVTSVVISRAKSGRNLRRGAGLRNRVRWEALPRARCHSRRNRWIR